jgi:hypothetical protein
MLDNSNLVKDAFWDALFGIFSELENFESWKRQKFCLREQKFGKNMLC